MNTSSFIVDSINLSIAGKEDMHKSLNSNFDQIPTPELSALARLKN